MGKTPDDHKKDVEFVADFISLSIGFLKNVFGDKRWELQRSIPRECGGLFKDLLCAAHNTSCNLNFKQLSAAQSTG